MMTRLRHWTQRCPLPVFVAVLRGRATSCSESGGLERAEVGLPRMGVPLCPSPTLNHGSFSSPNHLLQAHECNLPQGGDPCLSSDVSQASSRACHVSNTQSGVGWTMVLWSYPKLSWLHRFKWDVFLPTKTLNSLQLFKTYLILEVQAQISFSEIFLKCSCPLLWILCSLCVSCFSVVYLFFVLFCAFLKTCPVPHHSTWAIMSP